MSRRHFVAMGCVLAVTGLTLTGVPAAAGPRAKGVPVTAPAWKPPSGMLEALQRDLGLTREQAQARLLNEARMIPIEAQLRRRLGDRFGGSWLTGAISQTLVVATTDEADIPRILTAGARADVVGRSMAELLLIKEKVDEVLPAKPRVAGVRYIDAENNRVVILSAQPPVTEDLIKNIGVDAGAVSVAPSTEQPQPLHDVQGGDAYYIGSSNRCSVGFSVTHETQAGFVSAGHCGKAGDATTGFNRIPQGVFKASNFPGDDYAWVAVNRNWTARPAVNNGAGGAVPVVGSKVAVEGASVCRSGSTTDWQCGIILQRDTSITYPQGVVSGLTRTNACAEPGDSGGSFISVDQAQGVASGGSGDCTSGGVTYFQPVNEILAAYDLALVTNAITSPSTGTCTGYPKIYVGNLENGKVVYRPGSSYYRTTVAGQHHGCLDADDGVDLDLYLEKWRGTSWGTVAASDSPGPDEQISYIGTPGFYRYRVVSVSGSSPYTLGFTTP
ncbi:S1 family peptidase [Streptosporangium sp. NBC_01755]|uniref:S1 family peptidase n=1 Tax=unclassified Streptosporangium TaxID=2632669 RepID=UPI002DD95C8E|nr:MULTISPECIES: S1 family peptidase [unclassified Streptosporangium]WSA25760.1 S1 family peptidase [Streptosporangium sp. NBC_01810]WSD02850.1 S1 family peptidase [Streptosporangium sp. NBC_01755]